MNMPKSPLLIRSNKLKAFDRAKGRRDCDEGKLVEMMSGKSFKDRNQSLKKETIKFEQAEERNSNKKDIKLLSPLKLHSEMDNYSLSDDNSEPDYLALSSGRLTRTNTDMCCSTPGGNSINYSRTISSVSTYSELNDEHNNYYDPPVGWPISKIIARGSPSLSRLSMKKNVDVLNRKSDSEKTLISEMEMKKEKFAKLLLGEDMSGAGKGVCSAVAISNAITNLYATVFGHLYKLEPLPPEMKTMWRREMDCLLSICDSIIEFVPSTQNLPDGTTLDVMTTRPRADIYLNLPALQKLDDMLIETLESFEKTEFWYVEEGKKSTSATSKSFRKMVVQRSEDKWWLPVPCIPPTGLSEKARKELQQKRDCVHQIHKAAMAINNSILGEMEVPESYMATLPKSGKLSVGESIYHYMSTSEKFSPDYLLDCLDITSEHIALEVSDRVEAAMYVWRRKARMHASKSTWDMVKDLVADENKNKTLASRAEDLLLCLKQRHPYLSQTTLDTTKIQYNKDVGQAILESYSRVLESLAFNVVAWIDDVLFVDASVRNRPAASSQQRKP